MQEIISTKSINFVVAREGGRETNRRMWNAGFATLTPTTLTLAANVTGSALLGRDSDRTIDLDSISDMKLGASFGLGALSIHVSDDTYRLICVGAKAFKAQIEKAIERGAGSHVKATTNESIVSIPPKSASPYEPSPSVRAVVAPNNESQLVPCGQCGHGISRTAIACPACNTAPTAINIAPVAGSVPPATLADSAIRERLLAFSHHLELACLHCGYRGFMGLEAPVIPWFASWPVLLGGALLFMYICAIFGVGFIGVFVGVLTVWGIRLKIKPVVRCPSCETTLSPTG